MARRIDQFESRQRTKDIGNLETKKEKFINDWVNAIYPIGKERQAEIIWDMQQRLQKLEKMFDQSKLRNTQI